MACHVYLQLYLTRYVDLLHIQRCISELTVANWIWVKSTKRQFMLLQLVLVLPLL